jgi:signal transduction histidine kinase
MLTKVFTGIFADSPLLPRALIGEAASRDVFAVQVVDTGGSEVFAIGGDRSAYAGMASLPERLGRLAVHASIHADRASSLVIGGLPARRWPLAMTLFGLSTLLVGLAVRQMRQEVRFARRQSDFVSGVSHELRTPLAQIRLYGETLVLGRVRSDAERRRAAEVIVQESRRLESLVETVLLFSRMQRGHVEIQREPVDLSALTTDVIASFEPFAAAKRARVTWDGRGLDRPAHVDPNVCRQILLNLLDNAVKYGPVGQTIRVTVEQRDADVTFGVADQGPGVAPDERTRIWEPFWRAPGSAEGGSGLGLAIVSELAARHGGAARLDPSGERGARFVITLETRTPSGTAERPVPQPA